MNACDNLTSEKSADRTALIFDLGTFEGFSFRHQCAIDRILTADEVVNWDHDKNGEAEFWPSGDNIGVALVFRGQSSVTASELLALDRVLQDLGDDVIERFLRIYYALRITGADLSKLSVSDLDDLNLSIYVGDCFTDLRKDAAYELFETYWPEAYAMWESCNCDGLNFDVDLFLDSPSWSVVEVTLGNNKALLISPQ